MIMQKFGISAIGLAIPQYGLPLTEFAKIYGVNPQQYTDNLGCKVMSLCGPNENSMTLASQAAQRALNNWDGNKEDIGLVVVATETGLDMSRPLSSWVMSDLGLCGNIRSYEVKHACYGGTAAVRQALEWKIAGNSKNKAALVIAVLSNRNIIAEIHILNGVQHLNAFCEWFLECFTAGNQSLSTGTFVYYCCCYCFSHIACTLTFSS
mgnify:CR=1 FL=1